MKYIIFLSLIISSLAQAEINFESLKLTDQHSEVHTITEVTKLIIFSHDMNGKDIVHEAIKDQTASFLDAHKSIYVADINAMPAIIARLFAYPAMRGYPYLIWLDKDGSQTQNWPRKKGTVSLLKIESNKLIEHQFYTDSKALFSAISAIK